MSGGQKISSAAIMFVTCVLAIVLLILFAKQDTWSGYVEMMLAIGAVIAFMEME